MMNIERLTAPWWALRLDAGSAAFVAGLDKFFESAGGLACLSESDRCTDPAAQRNVGHARQRRRGQRWRGRQPPVEPPTDGGLTPGA
jgi:hypothetical protein